MRCSTCHRDPQSLEVHAAIAAASFEDLDTNKDGVITREVGYTALTHYQRTPPAVDYGQYIAQYMPIHANTLYRSIQYMFHLWASVESLHRALRRWTWFPFCILQFLAWFLLTEWLESFDSASLPGARSSQTLCRRLWRCGRSTTVALVWTSRLPSNVQSLYIYIICILILIYNIIYNIIYVYIYIYICVCVWIYLFIYIRCQRGQEWGILMLTDGWWINDVGHVKDGFIMVVHLIFE